MLGERLNTAGCDPVSQKIHLLLCKYTLGGVDVETRLLECRENLLKMMKMFFFGSAGNEDIIQIHKDETVLAEEAVHQSLECLGRIS